MPTKPKSVAKSAPKPTPSPIALKKPMVAAKVVAGPKPAVSRSQDIRAYLSQNPDAMPKDVVAALKGKGIIVAPGLVGLIKHQMKRGTGKSADQAIKKSAIAAKKVGRPKAGGVNRSEAVRKYLATHPSASPGEVQTALKQWGIMISTSLASAIKYAKPKGSAKKPAANAVGRPKGGVNKSQAIRDYLASNPGASPANVKRALRAKGIVVSDSLVGAIKYRKPAAGRRTGRPVGRPRGTKRLGRPPAAARNGSLRAEDLIEAKRFVDRVGGAGAARRAIEVLGQLS